MAKFNLSKLRNKHFLALAGNGVISVFGIGTMSLLYHSLSKQDVGKWFFFLTILSLLDAIRNGFLGTATVKFYAGTALQRSKEVMGSVWFLACALTAVAMLLNGLAMMGLSYAHSEELILSIKWVGITFLSTLPFSVIFWKLQADEQYGKILLLRLVNSGSTITAFAILMIMHQMTLERALLYNFLTNCLTSTVGLLTRLGKVRTVFSSTRATIMELVHYGKYSLATTLSANLLRSTDSFIVTYMLGPAALAIYNLPVRLMEIIEIPLRSFVGTGMSAMAIAYNSNNMQEVTKLLKKYAGMLSLALIPVSIGAALFADLAINILGGSKYFGTEAANLYRLFMAFAFMSPLDRFFGVTLDIIHQPKVNFYKVLLMLGVNIAADFAGIAAFGSIYGVALSSFMVTFTGVYFGYINLRRHIPFTIPDIYRSGYSELKQLYAKFRRKQVAEG